MSAAGSTQSQSEAREAVASNPFWYHTIEVAPGVATPGWFDLRPISGELPWPDVRGKRCLDVGTADGYLAFELERRGASEVVAADVPDHEGWDWPPHLRAKGTGFLRSIAGPEKGRGLKIAKDLLGSSIEPVYMSAYELSPERVGEFDVVVCGSLLLHLRDPLRALDSIRSVCRGQFLCTNQIELDLSLRFRRKPVARLEGTSDECQWWLPNVTGHRQMLQAMGFAIERESGRYSIPFGVGHPPPSSAPRALAVRAWRRAVAGGHGVPHHAILARPDA